MSLVPMSYVREGTGNHKLECRVISNPKAAISWSRNGRIAATGNDTVVTNIVNSTSANSVVSSSLVFKMVGKGHYGNYTCTASNELGYVVSKQLLVITCKLKNS